MRRAVIFCNKGHSQKIRMKLNSESAKAFLKGTSLNASGQQVTKVEPLSELTAVSRVDLGNNIIKTSESLQGLAGLTNLTWLNLSHNGLTSLQLPSSLAKLQVLNISHNKLQEFPDLSHFTNLKAVIANNNEISKVPPAHLSSSLNTLVLSHNKLELVPDLSGKEKLVKLSLSHNMVKEFPSKLPEGLAELRLNGNKLVQTSLIPSKVNLLDLGNNGYSSMEDLKGLTGGKPMKCLKNLSIKGNPLTKIDLEQLTEWFPRLTALDNKPLANK